MTSAPLTFQDDGNLTKLESSFDDAHRRMRRAETQQRSLSEEIGQYALDLKSGLNSLPLKLKRIKLTQ